MPLSARINIGDATLLIWDITESEDELRRFVTDGDISSAERFSNPKRRAEHLAWRAALREAGVGNCIAYDREDAPALENDGRHIAVAHTDGAAAVIISGRRCAIDIERADRDFSKTKGRFISEKELALPQSTDKLFPALIWCAKETLYKYSGRSGLDFIKDLAVTSIDPGGGTVTGRILKPCATGCDKDINMRFIRHGAYVVIYII